jgi:hypothetical protein
MGKSTRSDAQSGVFKNVCRLLLFVKLVVVVVVVVVV